MPPHSHFGERAGWAKMYTRQALVSTNATNDKRTLNSGYVRRIDTGSLKRVYLDMLHP